MKIGKYRVTELASIMFLAFGAFAVVYLFFKYIALTVLPFLIGWAFAFSVRPIACAVSKRTHIPVKVLRLFMTLSCLAVSGVLLWLGIGALWKEGVRLISYLEENPHIFDSMFKYLAENGKALEINTKTYQDYHGRTPVLDRNILLRFKELGGEAISLGSDSHNPERVGDKFREYAEFARSCGFTRLAHFENRRLILE